MNANGPCMILFKPFFHPYRKKDSSHEGNYLKTNSTLVSWEAQAYCIIFADDFKIHKSRFTATIANTNGTLIIPGGSLRLGGSAYLPTFSDAYCITFVQPHGLPPTCSGGKGHFAP